MFVTVLVLTAALLVGPIRLLGATGAATYDSRPRPRWAVGPRIIGAGGVVAYLIEATVVLMRQQADLPTWLWVSHAALGVVWWWLFLGRGRFAAAFTVACIDATASIMAVGAFATYGQPWAHLLWFSLAWLLVATTAIFGIWQAEGQGSDEPA